MAVYDANGSKLSSVYDANGNELNYAYDASGNVIYQKSSPISKTLKVMSYNVGQWYYGNGNTVPSAYADIYYALQNGMIQRANADIFCICEYRDLLSESGLSALEMLQQYYPYIQTYGGSEGGYSGRAICSKYPISNYVNDGVTNYIDTVTITIDSTEFTVGIVHLSTAYATRLTGVNKIIERYQGLDNVILCGDYNTLTICNGATTDTDDYRNVVKPLLNNGFKSANWSDFGFLDTYIDGTWIGCLDSIVTSSNLTINSVYVDTTKQTDDIDHKIDHMPIIAEILVN